MRSDVGFYKIKQKEQEENNKRSLKRLIDEKNQERKANKIRQEKEERKTYERYWDKVLKEQYEKIKLRQKKSKVDVKNKTKSGFLLNSVTKKQINASLEGKNVTKEKCANVVVKKEGAKHELIKQITKAQPTRDSEKIHTFVVDKSFDNLPGIMKIKKRDTKENKGLSSFITKNNDNFLDNLPSCESIEIEENELEKKNESSSTGDVAVSVVLKTEEIKKKENDDDKNINNKDKHESVFDFISNIRAEREQKKHEAFLKQSKEDIDKFDIKRKEEDNKEKDIESKKQEDYQEEKQNREKRFFENQDTVKRHNEAITDSVRIKKEPDLLLEGYRSKKPKNTSTSNVLTKRDI